MNGKGAAATLGGSTLASILVVWFCGSFFHVALSAEEGAAFSGVLSGASAAVWRYGIFGIVSRLLHGDDPEAPPVPHG